jgi:hypothetical protein
VRLIHGWHPAAHRASTSGRPLHPDEHRPLVEGEKDGYSRSWTRGSHQRGWS